MLWLARHGQSGSEKLKKGEGRGEGEIEGDFVLSKAPETQTLNP